VAIIEQMRTLLPKGQWKNKPVRDDRAILNNDPDMQYTDEL
jgi:hypothetical protein